MAVVDIYVKSIAGGAGGQGRFREDDIPADPNRAIENERTLNALLRTALQRKPLRDILLDCLDILLSVSWLAILPKGGVLLVQDKSDLLHLAAERNLSPELLELCAKVPFGRCLCGKAAATRAFVHASCVDERHEIRFDGMQPHGHYNVPLLDGDDVIGVLVLYLGHGYIVERADIGFLITAADVFSLVIQQKRLEQDIFNEISMVKQKSNQLETAIANIQQGLCMFDSSQRLIVSNKRYGDLYGLSDEQREPSIALRTLLEHRVAGGSVSASESKYIEDRINEITENRPFKVINRLRDGRSIVVEHTPMDDGGWVSTHEDITERVEVEKALARALRKLEEKQYAIDQAVIVAITDVKGKITYVNDNFCRISGCTRDELIGSNHRIVRSGIHSKVFFREMYRCIARGGVWRGEVCNKAKDGSLYWVDTTIVPQLSERGKPVVDMAFRIDITARKLAEDKISYLASHDELTGVRNRAFLVEKLKATLERSRQAQESFAVLLLDLDGFKNVNDTPGHAAGGDLLEELAARLKTLLRETDTLARLGGVEFAIIQGCDPDQRETAIGLAVRLLELVAMPFDLGAQKVVVRASIGIAFGPEDGTNPGELLQKADLALYRVKAEGRNNFRFFDEEMGEDVAARLRLLNELRGALAADQFELHYQPLLEAKTRRACGAEALVRWQHPVEGLIAPDCFIPLAEEAGLMGPLREWILERACKDAATWPDGVRVAVNLSAAQFRTGKLFDVILCALVDSGLSPERLELENIESVLMEGAENCGAVIEQLQNLGISIALDDFGTAYSSLSYLANFRFDKIKIDRSFTGGLAARAECASIIASVLTLARGLDILVTAEGVETKEQFELLRAAGVHQMQGYLFGRPCPVSGLNFSTIEQSNSSSEAA